jgi:N-methylhydantoinase A
MNDIVLGIDVGGTFTDILALDRVEGAIVAAFKVPTTQENPAIGAVTGVNRHRQRRGATASAVFHGTTIGTNTLIQKTGGPVALITTKGFRDVLALRRQARPRLYDLAPALSPPLVDRERRLEVDERLSHDGTPLVALTDAEIARVVAVVTELNVNAVAVSLIHAYVNDSHERMLGAALTAALPGLHITLSSDICREFREFERTSTAVVNAYIGPRVAGYVDSLAGELSSHGVPALSIVKSNGGLTAAANARRYPAHLIESGPAAGVIAAASLGRAEGFNDLIAFDMGGTTAKVGVIQDGQPRLSNAFMADRFVDGRDRGGYPIKSPVIDIIEIGAGGGSIARLDAAGVLKVGPQSAGADPGPAAYGRGGARPTITDAHVTLGHIAADGFGGKDLDIHPDRAEAAIASEVASPMSWSSAKAAWGILTLANANMAEMVRLATLRRGLDPRDFVMVAFGGAGPLHAAEIAREVGVPKVIIPPYPGLFSAIGTVLGNIRHDLVQTLVRRVHEISRKELEAAFSALDRRAHALISVEEVAEDAVWSFERFVDVRFEGQLFELTLPADGDASIEEGFRRAYLESYGYDLENHAVELVNLRLVAKTVVWDKGWPRVADSADASTGANHAREVIDADGTMKSIAIIRRANLKADDRLIGPLIIEDFGATIRVLEGQTMSVRASGVLVIETWGGQ